MVKQELIDELKTAQDQLKNYNRFLDLLKDEDDPKGILTRLNKTLNRILLLMKTNDFKDVIPPSENALINPVFGKTGDLVKVRPCGDVKTYLGFLIGEVANGVQIKNTPEGIKLDYTSHNPAIFIPELRKVVYGYESWWSVIENELDLKEISDDDISNVWYVKLLNRE